MRHNADRLVTFSLLLLLVGLTSGRVFAQALPILGGGGGGGGGGISQAYTIVADEGVNRTQRSIVNFIGTGIDCVDNAGATRTDCTISGGGGAPTTATYITQTADAGLAAAQNLDVLAANKLLRHTTGGVLAASLLQDNGTSLVEQINGVTAQDYRLYNTCSGAACATAAEWGEMAWTSTANTLVLRTVATGTGTVRSLRLNYGNSTSPAIIIPTATTTSIDIGSAAASAAIANGAVRLANFTTTATSGTYAGTAVTPFFSPTATSTLVSVAALINPTINYSNVTPGAGNYEGLRIAVTETALPTGQNYLIRARAGSAGTTEKFAVLNNGGINSGATVLTLNGQEVGLNTVTAAESAPGAAGGKFAFRCGTTAGTVKLVSYGGTSATPVTILDNIGAGVTGC